MAEQQRRDLEERSRAALERGAELDDAARLDLLEGLYRELEQELERDVDGGPPRR